jgi:hypothetical protein
MKHNRLFLALAVLVLATLACGLFGSKGSDPDVSSPPQGEEAPGAESPATGGGSGKYDTEFPLPSEVENFMDLGDGAINYQTSMELLDVVEFYRNEFANAGYVERDITTVINEDTFSIVWDGHPSGQAIVVQGVDLGNGTVNVNVRFEDV